jgi:hypothetical protein
MDEEMRAALEAVRSAFGDEARWGDPAAVIDLADKIEKAIDDKEVVTLLGELQEFVDARTRRIMLAATVIRALAVIGRIAAKVVIP